MASIQDVLELVTREQGAVASVTTLITQLEAQIKEATSGALPADAQAQVDQIFQIATANAAQLSPAIASGPATPAPTAVTPAPAPATPPATPPTT